MIVLLKKYCHIPLSGTLKLHAAIYHKSGRNLNTPVSVYIHEYGFITGKGRTQ